MVVRTKSVPAASKSVLAGAERRLLGSIKRGESRSKLSANAKRVRNAQLGRLKSLQLAASVPTDIDDDELQRHQDNLEVARTKWTAITVDEIIATYAKKLTEAP